MAYKLTDMQKELYTYRVTIFSPDPANTSGGVTSISYATETNVPAFRDSKSIVGSEDEFGRMPGDSRRDMDEWVFPKGVVIDDGCYIKDTTPGVQSNGRFWLVRGAPDIVSDDGIRQAGQVNCQCIVAQSNTLPTGVS